MPKLTLKQAALWCGGFVEEKYESVEFFGANNDTRILKSGELFIALQGARDGNDFVPAAMEKGAAAALCSRKVGDFPCILVPDTRIALGKIAARAREQMHAKVVGITGSVGKSTTKEMIASVLATTYRTGKTPVNHNNDIGMPMAILAMPEDTEIMVLEMGMNHFGEMAYLAQIARPDVAAIVNIGTMHMEHLGSRDGIRDAKLEITEGMRDGAKLLLNGDDDKLFPLPRALRQSVSYFGTGENAAVRALDIQSGDGALSFRAQTRSGTFPVRIAQEGMHFVPDALAAIAVALEFGVTNENIARGLWEFRNIAGRQELLTYKGCQIINDCYNAGPESVAASLAVLGAKKTRTIAVLGDMLELGEGAPAAHYRIGTLAAENADIVLTYGALSLHTARGAREHGAEEQHFDTHEALADALSRIVKEGDTILFKGSRGMHMEYALEHFLKK